MKEKIKKLWLEALRSGKYKQCKYRLYNDKEDAYCCLGILCEIHRKQTKSNKNYWTKKGDKYVAGNAKSSFSLPENVSKWANIEYKNEKDLVELNDAKNKSFKQIANFIEKHL